MPRRAEWEADACPPASAEVADAGGYTCQTYARCTKIVSRPAPLYYAHLAAAHAPWCAMLCAHPAHTLCAPCAHPVHTMCYVQHHTMRSTRELAATLRHVHMDLPHVLHHAMHHEMRAPRNAPRNAPRDARRNVRYEKDGFKEVSDTWEHGSTSSGGSRGSEKSKANYEPLHAKQASRLYYC